MKNIKNMTTTELRHEIDLRNIALKHVKESKRLILRRNFVVRKIFPIIRVTTRLADFFEACTVYSISTFFLKIYIKYMRKAIDYCDMLTSKIAEEDEKYEIIAIQLGYRDET